MTGFTLVKTSQGTYAIGGHGDGGPRNEVLQLVCPGDQISSCQWKEVGNLQFARYNHVSIALPDSFDGCNIVVCGTTKNHADFVTVLTVLSIVVLFSWSS